MQPPLYLDWLDKKRMIPHLSTSVPYAVLALLEGTYQTACAAFSPLIGVGADTILLSVLYVRNSVYISQNIYLFLHEQEYAC
jgi:hypothetical protein